MNQTAGPALSPADMTLPLITRHFSPAWFAAVMGTAAVPLALSFLAGAWIRPLAAIFMVLSILMFLLAIGPWTMRLFLYPDQVRNDFNHPVAASFLSTMPIALHVIALDLLKYPDLLLAEAVSRQVALGLWIAGSLGIYLLGFIVLAHVYRHTGIELAHANFGWYIPPVSKLLIPVGGFELAGLFPEHASWLAGLSLISLGVGFFLFLFVGSAVYYRYIFAALPPQKLAATFFIGIAPPAIIAVDIFKLMHLVQHHTLLGVTAEHIAPVARLLIIALWGLAAWWFLMGLILIAYYHGRLGLPFAMSWWAFTFPSAALGVASGLAWKVSQFEFIHMLLSGSRGISARGVDGRHFQYPERGHFA